MKSVRNRSLSKLLALWLVTSLGVARPVLASDLLIEPPADRPAEGVPLRATADAEGVTVAWQGKPATDRDGKTTVADIAEWPLGQYGDLRLPVQYVSLEAGRDVKITPALFELESSPWSGAFETIEPIVPRDPGNGMEYPELARKTDGQLPSGPVFVSHEGLMRGRRIIVLAISPFYATKDGPRIATRIAAQIAGARLLDQASATAFSTERGTELPLAKSALDGPNAASAYAINPLANQSALRITVTRPGLQRVPASALSSIGATLNATTLNRLRLFFLGNEVPLHWRDIGSNGSLDAGDEFVFFAPGVGDRYNKTSMYWMTVDASVSGARMATLSALVTNVGLPTATQVRERGTWQKPQIFQTPIAGLDGDHYFHQNMRAGFASGNAPVITVTTGVSMPATSGASVVTLDVNGRTGFNHTLVAVASGSAVTSTWLGTGDSSRVFTFAVAIGTVVINLVSNLGDSVLADTARWDRPVLPNVSGNGGDFHTIAGVEQIYSLAGYNAAWPMYDVTDPVQPKLLQTSGSSFQSGPAVRRVIVAGPSFVATPAVAVNTPVDLVAPRSADTVYIGPASLLNTLNPLVTLRQSQGYQVQVIDVAAIYATFGFGMVSPPAIRNFLRHAVGSWTRKPVAAVLAGDGTNDPFNYLQKTYAFQNYIPPYLLDVDPYAGETACETCYAQLDNDDPLSDGLPDIWLGRLPANSTSELALLVNKMVTYESSSTVSAWNKTIGWLADNYRQANGTVDPGGDFAAYQDRLANYPEQSPAGLAPPGTTKACVYFNPYLPTLGTNPCFRADATNAHTLTKKLVNDGAAVITYNGHGNEQQMATTDLSLADPFYALLHYNDTFWEGLSDWYGEPFLANGSKLPIMLQMTCLTGSFQRPQFYYPQSIDERLMLTPNGGALAVWGSSGSGVSHGHDYLARGFFNQLWSSQPGTARLGELVQAGYLNLFQGAYACCGDSIRTYLLLGDPLTKARVSFTWMGAYRAYVPTVRR